MSEIEAQIAKRWEDLVRARDAALKRAEEAEREADANVERFRQSMYAVEERLTARTIERDVALQHRDALLRERDEARAALAQWKARAESAEVDMREANRLRLAAHATMRRVGADTLAALDELARLVPKAHITPRTHQVLAKLRALAAELTKDL